MRLSRGSRDLVLQQVVDVDGSSAAGITVVSGGCTSDGTVLTVTGSLPQYLWTITLPGSEFIVPGQYTLIELEAKFLSASTLGAVTPPSVASKGFFAFGIHPVDPYWYPTHVYEYGGSHSNWVTLRAANVNGYTVVSEYDTGLGVQTGMSNSYSETIPFTLSGNASNSSVSGVQLRNIKIWTSNPDQWPGDVPE